MSQQRSTAFSWLALLNLLILGVALSASAQNRATDMPQQADQGRQVIQGRMPEAQGQADQVHQTAVPAPALSATLIDRDQKAKAREATIQVQVSGVEMVDPASVHEKPQQGQAHLHYQLDSGPVIATTATKLSFHELPPGKHQIKVMLAGNNHTPIGPKETLQVTVPKR